jgi:8-oxo-dGTP diphosphatase
MTVEVRAAGGVVWREGPVGVELLVVHRPKYRDWTFAKGKLEPGEGLLDAAVREVEEETGLRCRVGDQLAVTTYVDQRGRSKSVTYWTMTVRSGRFRANPEVDRIAWWAPATARQKLTYDRDQPVIDAFDLWWAARRR